MCVVSNIADDFNHDFWITHPHFPEPNPVVTPAKTDWSAIFKAIHATVTRAEFDALKKEVEQLREQLKQAQKVDELTNQPNCDTPNKFDLIKALARELGVDLSELKLNE